MEYKEKMKEVFSYEELIQWFNDPDDLKDWGPPSELVKETVVRIYNRLCQKFSNAIIDVYPSHEQSVTLCILGYRSSVGLICEENGGVMLVGHKRYSIKEAKNLPDETVEKLIRELPPKEGQYD